jgi:transcription initiation factor IIE alpha subunit
MSRGLKGEYKISHIAFENHKVPEFKEVRGKDIILFGDNNLYPQYLIELVNRSSKHNAIITGKAAFITGQGFETSEDSALQSFINNTNGDNLNKVLYKAAWDLELFGGFALQIDFGILGNKIALISHIDISKLRKVKDESIILYSDNWALGSRAEKITYKVWDATAKREGTYIYYFKQYRTGIETYPIPEYIGSIAAIETDVEINNFHLNNIKQGFAAGMMVNFNNGVPNNPEKQREIERKLKAKFQGTDNAGGVVINFSDSPEKKPDILPLQPSDLDKQFEQLRKDTNQEIFTGHKITSPQLFGVDGESAFSRNVINDAQEAFQVNYITPKQRLLEECFNYLAKINGIVTELVIVKNKSLGIAFSEQTVVSVMTKEEIREHLGLPPLAVNVVEQSPDQAQPQGMVNDHLKGLTGRQTQNLMRIVRNYDRGKITKDQALLMIKSGFGLSDEEALTFLGETNDQQFSIDLSAEQTKILQLLDKAPMLDDKQLSVLLNIQIEFIKPLILRLKELGLIEEVNIAGEHRRLLSEAGEKYAELYSGDFTSEVMDDKRKLDIFMSFGEEFTKDNCYKFASEFELTQLDKSILASIKGNKRLDISAISRSSKVNESDINDRLIALKDEGIINIKEIKSYGITELEYKITDKGNSIFKDSEPKVKMIEVFYKYGKNPTVKGPAVIDTTREFCREMINATNTDNNKFKLFSRTDINKLSNVLGYNVWEQRGGYYHNPNNNTTTPYCRHIWQPVKIVKK